MPAGRFTAHVRRVHHGDCAHELRALVVDLRFFGGISVTCKTCGMLLNEEGRVNADGKKIA